MASSGNHEDARSPPMPSTFGRSRERNTLPNARNTQSGGEIRRNFHQAASQVGNLGLSRFLAAQSLELERERESKEQLRLSSRSLNESKHGARKAGAVAAKLTIVAKICRKVDHSG
jgi:hypothetical protein